MLRNIGTTWPRTPNSKQSIASVPVNLGERRSRVDEDFAIFIPCQVWTTNKERSMHHFTRAALVKPAREAAKLLTLTAIRNNKLRAFDVPVHVEFFPTQARRGSLADTANHLPPCKAVLDGIVDAGLIVDDTPEYVLSQRFWPPIKDEETGVGVMISPSAVT